MKTFARIVDSHATDIQVADDRADILMRYPEQQIEAWGGIDVFVEVPDGTMQGALRNQDGTFSNPAEPPTPEPVAIRLTKAEFLALYAQNNADIQATLDGWPTA